MQTMLEVLLITCLVSFALVVIGVVIGWRAVRRVRRTARVRLAAAAMRAARRAVSSRLDGLAGAWSPPRGPGPDRLSALADGAYVSARAWLPGPARSVWVLCRDLERDVASAVFAVRAAEQAGRPVQELQGCLAMLTEHARDVQLDLRVIAAEPDAAVRAHLLSAHAARTSLIRQTCANVRAAVLSGGSVSRQPELERIVTDVNDAALAVRLRAAAYRELSRQ
jgi:hypothetical protein